MGKREIKFDTTVMLLLLIPLIMMTGCWDRREIEDLGIIVGVAIDRPEQTEAAEKEEKEAVEHKHVKRHRLTLTQQFVVPEAIGVEGKGGSPGKKPYSNVSSEGDTIFSIIRQCSTVSSRPPLYKHLKVIVIGEDVARSINLQMLTDFFLREPELRRSVKIMIAKGKARAALEAETEIEDLPATKLLKLTENMYKTSRMAPKLTLGEVSEKMAAGSSFIMQRVVTHQGNVKLAGAAVIKGKTNRLIGWLGEEEIDGINWLSGEAKGGVVEAVDEQTKEMVIYEFLSAGSSIKPEINEGEISFTVEIESEGRLGEDWTERGDAFDEKFIQRLTKSIEDEIRLLVNKALQKTQKEFKVDVAGFGKQLSIKYPKVWQQVKGDWDQTFSQVPVRVKVKVYIRHFALKGTKK